MTGKATGTGSRTRTRRKPSGPVPEEVAMAKKHPRTDKQAEQLADLNRAMKQAEKDEAHQS